jgi:hypothetical protein
MRVNKHQDSPPVSLLCTFAMTGKKQRNAILSKSNGSAHLLDRGDHGLVEDLVGDGTLLRQLSREAVTAPGNRRHL